jgi:putative SOS response-associated peptidase YedK
VVALHFKVEAPTEMYKRGIGPWGRGPFVRVAAGEREGVVGHWALIADNARESKSAARIMTNNARSESIATKPTFRGPWARGQRCLIPAESFLEPNSRTGRVGRMSGGAFGAVTAIRSRSVAFGIGGPIK